MNDWRSEIVRGVLVQQRIEELDKGRLWVRHLPEVAAAEAMILAAERQIGHRLDPLYRDFLGYADGWQSFLQAIDLFGTSQLAGAAPMDRAQLQIDAVEDLDFAIVVGMPKDDVLPIGASVVQSDIFLIGRPESRWPGTVVWYTGEVIERFTDFDEFYLAMIDYNREVVRQLETATNP
jgi:hypothetical protein